MLKVIEDEGGGHVGRLLGLPRVDHEEARGLLGGDLAHAAAVAGGCEAALLVGVGDGGEVGADELKVCVVADVVCRHDGHAQVKEGDGAVGAGSDEDEGLAVGFGLLEAEAVLREGVAGGRHGLDLLGGGDHGEGSRTGVGGGDGRGEGVVAARRAETPESGQRTVVVG